MKNFLMVIGSLIGTACVAVLVWICLYLSIPAVKDNTDKIFKWNDYAETEITDTETSANMIPTTLVVVK